MVAKAAIAVAAMVGFTDWAHGQPARNPIVSTEGQWDFLSSSDGQALAYEIYDTFPPITLRCPLPGGRIEFVFWVQRESARDFEALVLERAGGDQRFRSTYEPDQDGHPFGYAVASLSTSDPAVRALEYEQTPMIFRTISGRRFGFPYDTSISRLIHDCSGGR